MIAFPLQTTQKLICIAALDVQNGIAKNGGIPWDIPEDRAFFRSKTMGFPTLMGRKTFETLGARPLPHRPAAVWSQSLDAQQSPMLCVDCQLPNLLTWCFAQSDTVFCIGGAQIYAALLPIATDLYLSRIQQNWNCDLFFPSFPAFRCISSQTMSGFIVEHWVRKVLLGLRPKPRQGAEPLGTHNI